MPPLLPAPLFWTRHDRARATLSHCRIWIWWAPKSAPAQYVMTPTPQTPADPAAVHSTRQDPPFVEDDFANDGDPLVINLDGFEGPIDLLLTLARQQKVDLTKISLLALAEQYLAFIHRARVLRIEIAADYLVVAAWLAYLKSRLLLPKHESEDDEPTGEELAAALAFQLQRLEAMRNAGQALFANPLLERDFFLRGAAEGLPIVTHVTYDTKLHDVLQAYGAISSRGRVETLHIEQTDLYTIEEALQRLTRILGTMPDWTILQNHLPAELLGEQDIVRRSALAATFGASLELARDGYIELRQDQNFGPIYIRPMPGGRRSDLQMPKPATAPSDPEDAQS